MQNLTGKVALVTGSGRGIGRSIALKLAKHGARVVVNDLDIALAEEVVAIIQSLGGEAIACVGSVTEVGFAERFVNTAMTHFQGLDIIVNNAGYTWDNVIQKMTDEQWDAMLDVHVKAPFRILRAAQPIIRHLSKAEAEAGKEIFRKVVNISSIAGLGGNVNIEGRDINVGINPSLAKMFEQSIPIGRAGTPDEAADAVYLLCLPESNYISGQTLVCGGGISI